VERTLLAVLQGSREECRRAIALPMIRFAENVPAVLPDRRAGIRACRSRGVGGLMRGMAVATPAALRPGPSARVTAPCLAKGAGLGVG
jgi:hypothetical protein